jgi:hypothetical protein
MVWNSNTVKIFDCETFSPSDLLILLIWTNICCNSSLPVLVIHQFSVLDAISVNFICIWLIPCLSFQIPNCCLTNINRVSLNLKSWILISAVINSLHMDAQDGTITKYGKQQVKILEQRLRWTWEDSIHNIDGVMKYKGIGLK